VQFVFEDYLLDPDRRELTRGSKAISIGPQVFDLLLHLVRNREHVVSKDDLLDGVWGGRIVSESTLTSHINAVRKAIGDSGEEQRLIRTIARKGFRFVGDVREAQSSDGFSSSKTESAKSNETTAHALALPDKPSIAALPFQNLSGDPEQDYFADGVVEDIITALSRIRWLFVSARNSSFTYKGRTVDVKQVGRELGVRYVLEGSMRKAAKRVRITGQLIDATTGGHLWADRFEGHPRGYLRAAGPGNRKRRRRGRAAAGAGRDRTREAEANRKPRRLRLLSPRNGELSSGNQGGSERGSAVVLQSDTARSGFRFCIWDGGVVLFLAQTQ
jgi:TolB-like protein